MEAHEAYKASRWLEAAQKYESAVNGDPTLRGAHFFLANSYDNLYKPSRAGRTRERRLHAEGDRVVQEGRREGAGSDLSPARDAVPGGRLRPGKAQQSRRGRADRQAHDRDGPQRIPQLSRARRRSTRTPAATTRPKRSSSRPARSSPSSRKSTPPSRPSTTARASSRRRSRPSTRRADLQPENPQGYQLVAVFYWEKAFKDKRLTVPQQKEYIAKGIEGDGQGAQAQPGLHRRADLQEHPPPDAGQPRDRPQEASAAHRRGRQAPEQGARS